MTDAAHNQHWETRRPSDRDDCGEQKARRALSLRRTPPSIRAERRRFKFASPDAGAIRIGQHDGMPDPEIRPRLLDGTLTPGVAHGQDEGLLLDRPVNVPVPSTSMRVPQLSPVSPVFDSYGRFEETVASILGYGVISY